MDQLPRHNALGRYFDPAIPTLKIAKVIRVRPGGNRIDVAFMDGGYGTAIPVVSGCASSIAGLAHLIGPTVDAQRPCDPTYGKTTVPDHMDLSAGQDPAEFNLVGPQGIDFGSGLCWIELGFTANFNSDGSVAFSNVENVITAIDATAQTAFAIGEIGTTLSIAALSDGIVPPLTPFITVAAGIAIAVESMLNLFGGGRPKFQDTDAVITAYKASAYWPLHSLAADLQIAANNGAPISDSNPAIQAQFSTWKRGTIESIQGMAGWQPGPESPGYWQLQRLINLSWDFSKGGVQDVLQIVRAIDKFAQILACLFIHRSISEDGGGGGGGGGGTLPPPPIQQTKLEGNRDIYAVCQQAEGHLVGNAGMICLGFLYNDDKTEMLFPQDGDQKRFADFMLFRHPSDVQITIDKLGCTSIQHPSGARVTIGDTTDALGESVITPNNVGVNLQNPSLDANGKYKLKNNLTRPTGIVLRSAAGDYIRIWNGKIEIFSPSVTVNGHPV